MQREREFVIDPEFAGLLRPLTAEELADLERNLLADGRVLKPLAVWGETDILLDGHHRLELARKHGLPFKVVRLHMPDRTAALAWVVRHQLGQRNVTPEQESYLRGKRYQQEKKKPHRQAKDKGGTLPPLSEESGGGKTAERLAREFGVDESTIHRDAKYAEAVDKLERELGPDAKAEALNGKLSKKEVVELAAEPAPPPADEPAEHHPDPVRDGYGNEIPEHLAEVFAVRLLGKEAQALGRKLQNLIHRIACHPGGAFLRAELQHTRKGDGELRHTSKKIAEGLNDLKFYLPFSAVCPRCHRVHPGRVAPDCPLCKGAGWLTRWGLNFAERPHREAVEAMGKAAREAAKGAAS